MITSCIVCKKSFNPEENEGKFFGTKNNKYYICKNDWYPFSTGKIIGRLEFIGQILDHLQNEDDGEQSKQNFMQLISGKENKAYPENPIIMNPREIVNELNRYVVGQEEAKKRLGIAVYEHQCISFNKMLKLQDKKSNILFLGPSGTGKTLLSHTIAKSLDVPFVSVDATNFSPVGFHGADVDTMVGDLLAKSGGNIAATERGVIFIDEIDKISYNSASNNSDTLMKGVQSSLLRLLEGKEVKVPTGPMNKSHIIVRTDNILFICGGVFPNLSEILEKKMGREKKMGFSHVENKEQTSRNFKICKNAPEDIMTESLMDYGLISELVGRLSVIVPLSPLNESELKNILSNLSNSPFAQQKEIFKYSGYDLEFDNDTTEKIIQMALKMSTGARALDALTKRVVSSAAFNLLGESEKKETGKVIIKQECLENPDLFIFEKSTTI